MESPEAAGPGGATVGPMSVPQRLRSQLFCPSVVPGMVLSSAAVGLRTVLTVLLQDPALRDCEVFPVFPRLKLELLSEK